MTQAAFGGKPFSASIGLHVEVKDERIPLSHLAPGWFRCQVSRAFPAGKAVLVTRVDNRTRRRAINLRDGIAANGHATRFEFTDEPPF